MNPIFTKMVDAVEAANATPDDYINPVDGMKYCGKCHTPKEAFFPDGMSFNGSNKHPAHCECAARALAEKEAEEERKRHRNNVAMLRAEAFRDIPSALWRFDTAPTMTAQLAKAKKYAEKWDNFRQDGIGLRLFGDVGTGKTYAAGCIANALIDWEISVLMVSVSDAVNRMQGSFGADRDSYMKFLMRADLLILDDLGAERDTSFGKERVFDVINRRWLTGKPMIVLPPTCRWPPCRRPRTWVTAASMTAFWKLAFPSALTGKTSGRTTPDTTWKRHLVCCGIRQFEKGESHGR